jgi:membrane protein DedA with SNARE-associated domain
MTLDQVVQIYGYPALLIGTILEGETILVVAGFLAHRGYMQLPWVIFVAFAGSFLGDQSWFQIGRAKGVGFIEARPNWRPGVSRVRQLLERHRLLILVGFRFLYGLRNVTPFVVGATGFPIRQFILLNSLGAAIWSVTVASLGYFFGRGVEAVLEDIKNYELILVAAIAVGGAGLWLAFHLRRRRQAGPRGEAVS